MDENEVLNNKKREILFPFIITQCVCVVIILIVLLVTKLFFKNTYNKAKIWYEKNVCVDTSVSEVLVVEDEI